MGAKRRVVIIDDEPAFAETLTKMVKSLGFEVTVSTDARSSYTFELKTSDVVFVDVREPNEYNLGRVPGAMPLPRGTIENRAESSLPRDRPLVLYCGGGSRSALAADTLQQMGWTDVRSMAGGFRSWVENGGEVEG